MNKGILLVEWVTIAESVKPVGIVVHVVAVVPLRSSATHCEVGSAEVVEVAILPGMVLVPGILTVQNRP